MSLKQFKIEQSNAKIKIAQGSITNAINLSKTELEDIIGRIKSADSVLKYTENQIKDCRVEIKRLESIIGEKNAIIDTLKKSIGNLSGKENSEKIAIKKAIDVIKKKSESDILAIQSKIHNFADKMRSDEALVRKLSGAVAQLGERKDFLDEKIADCDLELDSKQKKLDKIQLDIVAGESILAKTKKYKSDLETIKKEVASFSRQRDDLENQIIIRKDDILKLDRCVKELSEDIAHKAEVFSKKEGVLIKRENDLDEYEISLNEKNARIETLGNTLQKHLNKQGMGHIKVFN